MKVVLKIFQVAESFLSFSLCKFLTSSVYMPSCLLSGAEQRLCRIPIIFTAPCQLIYVSGSLFDGTFFYFFHYFIPIQVSY